MIAFGYSIQIQSQNKLIHSLGFHPAQLFTSNQTSTIWVIRQKVNKEQVILVSSNGTPDNIPLIPQNRHGTPEKSNIIGWNMMVRLKITSFHSNS